MTVAMKPMNTLYKKLSNNGFSRPFVKSLLPEWWNDKIADTPSGLQQVGLILGRALGIKPSSLWAKDLEIELSIPNGRKFKRRADSQEDSLDIACAIAFAVARIALRGYQKEFNKDALIDSSQLREMIINKESWVGLNSILAYCSNVGIPVIHLKHFPKTAKKMAGLAFDVSGRPVIVLTQSQKNGYMLFDLAHELGHVSLGHVQEDNCIVDEKIEQNSEDPDEKAANRFALDLLTGSPDCKIVPTGRNLSGQELATSAERYGRKNHVDPTHVALNYAYSTSHWPVAQIALAKLAGEEQNDQEVVRQALFDNIDNKALGDDDLVLLEKYC